MLISKFMVSQPGKKTVARHILSNQNSVNS